jgi:squalene-hopene/tetraprenyl-beta-curcumene cyclase
MRRLAASLGVVALTCVLRPPCLAADAPADIKAIATRGVGFFKTTQAADGSFNSKAGPGVTAIVAAAMLESGQSADDPVVAKALAYVKGFAHEDGGIYPDTSTHRNYETCVAMMCFQAANKDGRYDAVLKAAEAYIKKVQWDEDEKLDPSALAYGGAGYGGSSRPDLSNTAFLIEALKNAGETPEDPAIQRALIFVSRCQNFPNEYNTTEIAAKNPDGGFFYTIAGGGSSPAGKTDDGGLRSYGSMTYAGLKSMIYAGVKKDDPRVKAALEWIGKNYTVTENPGFGDSGLYYYLHTFAKALDAMGEPTLTDAKGASHDWRKDLVAQLAASQKADGSWVNSNKRWLEDDPNLVTAYALLALAHCQ